MWITLYYSYNMKLRRLHWAETKVLTDHPYTFPSRRILTCLWSPVNRSGKKINELSSWRRKVFRQEVLNTIIVQQFYVDLPHGAEALVDRKNDFLQFFAENRTLSNNIDL